MNTQCLRFAIVGVVLLLSSGCAFRNFATDQAQIDSMTFCEVHPTENSLRTTWGRREDPNSGQTDWSHFSLGEFACKTQDEWLCQARNGATKCDRNQPFTASTIGMAAGAPSVSDATLRRYRNETVAEMMMQSDRICDRHLASIFGTQAYVGLSTDIAGSLLSGGAAIASGIAARNLTAGAAMVGATKSHISADVYQGKVATAINLIIRKERNATRTVLRTNQSCSPSTYTAAEAVQDALNYHNMCSFEYGLSELVREASDTSPLRAPLAASLLATSEAELKALKDELETFKGSDAEKAELKSRIDKKTGQIDFLRAFGISDAALPVASGGTSDRSAKSAAPVAGAPAPVAAGAAPIQLVEQRSCD